MSDDKLTQLFEDVKEDRIGHIVKQLHKLTRTGRMNVEGYVDRLVDQEKEAGLIKFQEDDSE